MCQQFQLTSLIVCNLGTRGSSHEKVCRIFITSAVPSVCQIHFFIIRTIQLVLEKHKKAWLGINKKLNQINY